MALESSTYINGLVAANPTSSDNISDGDNHIRLIKSTIKATFPSVTGAITKSHTQLNTTVATVEAATNANTASTIVKRNASGNFNAGTITAALSGNATTATTLQTSRTIALAGDVTGSVSFNGSQNVSITATIGDDSHNHVVGNIDNFTENVQDIVGGMFDGNTETGLSATYQDSDGTIDLVLTKDPTITLTGDVTGTGTMTNLGNVSITATVADDSHNHVVSNIDSFTENVQDIVGAMFDGNTETGLSATYQDTDGTIDLTLTKDPTITLTGDVTGTGTMTNLGDLSFAATVTDDSHNHVVSNIDNFTENVQDIAGGMFDGNTETGVSATYQDGDGTVDLVLSTEYVQDIVGAMFDGNTETGLSATYQDTDGTIDLVLTKDPTITFTGDVSGTGTMTNLGDVSISVTVANDSHTHDTRYFTETQADARFLAIAGTAADSAKVDGKSVAVVSSLPGSPDANTIYFVTS